MAAKACWDIEVILQCGGVEKKEEDNRSVWFMQSFGRVWVKKLNVHTGQRSASTSYMKIRFLGWMNQKCQLSLKAESSWVVIQCKVVLFHAHVPVVWVWRQDEHPFCYPSCPFISRLSSFTWILLPRLIIGAVQRTCVPPECSLKLNYYSSMRVSADFWTVLFATFTIPIVKNKQVGQSQMRFWKHEVLK